MRRAALAIVTILALAACNPSAPSGEAEQQADAGGGLFPDLTSTAYRAEATLTNENGETMPVVMIRDGRKLRMEVNSAQGASTMISNAETGESFILSTAAGRTMALRATGLSEQFANPADAWQGELATTATRTGDCSVAGENGAEWTKTTAEDGTDTVCVTQDGIILRATDDGRVAWETTSVQRGAQEASLFQLPPGVQVVDLGDMGGAAQRALEAAKQRSN